MATEYSVLYNRFLSKVTDYDILKYVDIDRENILLNYLISAIVAFRRTCKVDLDERDDELGVFHNTLDDEVVEILTTGMLYAWLKPKVYHSENLKNVLNTKDLAFFSPANLLKELQSLRDSLYTDFRKQIIQYSYENGDLVNVGGGS